MNKVEKYVDGQDRDMFYEDDSGTRFWVTSLACEKDGRGEYWDDRGYFYALYAHNPNAPFHTDRHYFRSTEGLITEMKTISSDMRKWHVVSR